MRLMLPLAWTVILMAVSVKGGNKANAYNQLNALKPATLQEVCDIILFNTRPKTTITDVQTATVTQAASTVSVNTGTTVTPATSTIVDTITDSVSTTTSSPTITVTNTYITTILPPPPSQNMNKRGRSKHDRNLAHYFLRKYDTQILRTVCIDLLYQGSSAQAPTSTVYASTTTTVTQSAQTVTSTQVSTITATTPKVTQTVHTIPVVTVTAATSSVTVSTTSTAYLTLSTNSATYCSAQSAGCSCVVGAGPSVTCTYTPVGQPSFFVAPCTGNLAVQLQGGAGGQSMYKDTTSLNGDSSLGSYAYVSAISSNRSSATITPFATGSSITIRVGANGSNAGPAPFSYGYGGYNGGGNGGCNASIDGPCSGGGGGATDLSYNGQILVGVGGAGGGGEGHHGLSPDPNHVTNLTPQGGSASVGNSGGTGTGGGGGGGYPGGQNGYYDSSPGWAGLPNIPVSNAYGNFSAIATSGTARAVLTFTCIAL